MISFLKKLQNDNFFLKNNETMSYWIDLPGDPSHEFY